MALPAKIRRAPKRASRWRSQAHTGHVRSFACAMCGSMTNIEAAHVRMGSGAGGAQKPDDWRTAPLCAGLYSNIDGQLGCHNRQHATSEPAFWREYEEKHGQSVEQLLADLIKTSPRRLAIEAMMKERADAAPHH